MGRESGDAWRERQRDERRWGMVGVTKEKRSECGEYVPAQIKESDKDSNSHGVLLLIDDDRPPDAVWWMMLGYGLGILSAAWMLG
jgi:hypothetical protein